LNYFGCYNGTGGKISYSTKIKMTAGRHPAAISNFFICRVNSVTTGFCGMLNVCDGFLQYFHTDLKYFGCYNGTSGKISYSTKIKMAASRHLGIL
jgi:hypothetical protein